MLLCKLSRKHRGGNRRAGTVGRKQAGRKQAERDKDQILDPFAKPFSTNDSARVGEFYVCSVNVRAFVSSRETVRGVRDRMNASIGAHVKEQAAPWTHYTTRHLLTDLQASSHVVHTTREQFATNRRFTIIYLINGHGYDRLIITFGGWGCGLGRREGYKWVKSSSP